MLSTEQHYKQGPVDMILNHFKYIKNTNHIVLIAKNTVTPAVIC